MELDENEAKLIEEIFDKLSMNWGSLSIYKKDW